MTKEVQRQTLEHMTDGLITLEEGRERYLKAGGSPEAFKAFAVEHKHEIFHGDPITGEKWPWPEELSAEPQKPRGRGR